MTLPGGFRAGGTAAGIKASGLDLALIAAERPVPTAAVFTTSAAPAAPVQLSRRHAASGAARAVVLNSGCANAATGDQGRDAAQDMAATTADLLGADAGDVLVCSTGLIGTTLPVDRIRAALPGLVAEASPEGLPRAAEAIMTTDSHPKLAVSGGVPSVTGMAKGAGMIRPDMATMLAVLMTDAMVDPQTLGGALRSAVAVSFNALTVDGCMSTNDTVIAMASGESGIEATADSIEEQLTTVCIDLAKQMAADGEGATKLVTIEVTGAESSELARRLGLAIGDSTLVRSAFAAADPNWGRVVAALGAAGQDPSQAIIAYDGIEVARDGVATTVDPAGLRDRLSGDFTLSIDLGSGPGSAAVFTCDLTPGYVVENMETS